MSSSRCRLHERLDDREQCIEAKRLLDPSVGTQCRAFRRRRFTSGNDDGGDLSKVRIRQQLLADVISAQTSGQRQVQQDEAKFTWRRIEHIERLLASRHAGRVVTVEIEQLKQTLPYISAIFDNEDRSGRRRELPYLGHACASRERAQGCPRNVPAITKALAGSCRAQRAVVLIESYPG
jgi:hypothetical protein